MDRANKMGQEKLPGPHFLVRMTGFAHQVALAHFVGPGPFLASGQLSLVVRGGRDNQRFSKFATLFEKVAFLAKLEQNRPI